MSAPIPRLVIHHHDACGVPDDIGAHLVTEHAEDPVEVETSDLGELHACHDYWHEVASGKAEW